MRKLASIVQIATSDPIPDSDKLSVVTMEGKAWRIVTGRDEFHPGDIAVYFEIDSALPVDDERYSFLHERCLRTWRDKRGREIWKQAVRIRTIKLRGVISQGLVMPIASFPELANKAIGEDATDILRVEHYDEICAEMQERLDASKQASPGKQAGNFPAAVPKTDEERIQNLADWPSKLKGILWEVTEKKDGSSCTFCYFPSIDPEDPFAVCSRNFRLKREDIEDSAWWQMAIKYNVESKLKMVYETTGRELALQGEVIGPGMNGNRDNLPEREFRVFRIWNIGQQQYMPSSERVELCFQLGIPHVPVLNPAMDVFTELPTVDDVLSFAEGLTDNGNEREGLVFKEADSTSPRSFKAVSNRYLLKLK